MIGMICIILLIFVEAHNVQVYGFRQWVDYLQYAASSRGKS